jgi:hypothetical protein
MDEQMAEGVSAAAGTAFVVGGNGLSGALDNVSGSGASVTVQAKSHVALNGSSDAVTMGAGSNLAVNGSNDAITATKRDGTRPPRICAMLNARSGREQIRSSSFPQAPTS